MNITDISFSNIELLQPKPINQKYIFDVNYDSKPFIIQCSGIMKTKISHQLLNITNKNDLLYLHKTFNHLVGLIFENQSKWFENEFTRDELKDMFVDIFIPNIELNCLDMTCNMVSKPELQDNISIIPLFNFKNITFDGKKFQVTIDLEDYHIINNVENTGENEIHESEEPLTTDESENIEKESVNEVNDEEKEAVNDEPEQTDEVDKNQEPSNEEQQINEENTDGTVDCDEIELDTNNLEVLDLEVNEDDIYLIYKLIQNNVYKNMNENLRNIFESKNIDISKIDINELIYDSDDSDEENEEEAELNVAKDDFETNFNKLL